MGYWINVAKIFTHNCQDENKVTEISRVLPQIFPEYKINFERWHYFFLINHTEKKVYLQLNDFQFSKMNKLLSNSVIFLYKFCFPKRLCNGFSH